MKPVSSWGRLSALPHEVVSLNDAHRVAEVIAGAALPGLAFGMGRSYGDVCLNPGAILWHTTGLNHFIGFDDESGRLICEAGVLLRDIQRLVIPRGWILPVTPGTQMITVGGAIANDVHGKNHHVAGSFGDHVQHIKLARTNGEIIDCSAQQRSEWFAATIGGMGLTGVIVQAEIQLQRVAGPWLDTETLAHLNLEQFFKLADESEAGWQHTVSWIDCNAGKGGRGLFMRGNPTHTAERRQPDVRSRRMPLAPPVSLVNRWLVRPFNSAYFNLKKNQPGRALRHYESFFYPLDNLLEWNRMYGPKGFFQYQCVLPRVGGQAAVDVMLAAIARSGESSFMAVLKTFGERQALGMMSFPQPGVTLALDFPNRGAATLRLFESLDAIVRGAGGRLYAAKDARMPRDLFEAGYPRLEEFLNYRDPGISSALSRRLMGS